MSNVGSFFKNVLYTRSAFQKHREINSMRVILVSDVFEKKIKIEVWQVLGNTFKNMKNHL